MAPRARGWWVACAALLHACVCAPPEQPPPADCASCLGCCNEGRCESGLSSRVCGAHGAACVACPGGAPCIRGVCEAPDGGPISCSGSVCPEGLADVCVEGGCQCGANPPCPPGTRCNLGSCECTPATCPNGCCSGNACVFDGSQSRSACGAGGEACRTCSVDAGTDTCFRGQCGCGLNAPCLPSSICGEGVCTCVPSWCDGCCSGSGCVQPQQQTRDACGHHVFCFSCGATGDGCRDGACACGDGGRCGPYNRCVNGRCVCDSSSCVNGCCAGDTCVLASAQNDSTCGPYGSFCVTCPADAQCQAFGGCTCAGRVECGVGDLGLGADHSCVVTASREVRCWGANAGGQLGVPRTDGGTDRPAPATIPLLGPVTEVAAGDTFGCAVGGEVVRCWGDTPVGSFASPVLVMGAASSHALAVGANHACALADDSAWCWGDDRDDQVAGSGAMRVDPPRYVSGLGGVPAQIAPGGHHTCALVDGGVLCWGHFTPPTATAFDSSHPAAVPGLQGVRLVASGDGLTCAAVDGGVSCFGRTPLSTVPVDAVALGVGDDFACAVTHAGKVLCWGDNALGQLGHPDGGLAEVLGVTGATDVACGRAHACAIVQNHRVACWGDGAHYKLGNGSTAPQPAAVLVSD